MEMRMPVSVADVNHRADHEPDAESNPGFARQANHDEETGQGSQWRHDPDQGHPEGPIAIRFLEAQHDDARAHERKSEERPDIVNSTNSLMFATEEQTATTMPVMMVVTCGVRNLGWTLEAQAGSNPSRPMEKKIRGCPAW